MLKIEDLMTEKVLTVHPETSLAQATILLNERDFVGLPVVDSDGKLVGMFTERSMITNRSFSHVQTLLRLFSELKFYKKDISPIRADLEKIIALKVSDVMQSNPTTVMPNDDTEKASSLFADPINNPLPVVNQGGKLVGILSMSDLTKLYGVPLHENISHNQIDKNIDQFVANFEKQFVVVSKMRTRTWLIVSISFAFVGFAIAMFLILRVNF